jgi:L-seryl-tRNA(Ser) seleniumtransferase
VLHARAEKLAGELTAAGVAAEVVASRAVVGGGGAPGVELPSTAVALPEEYGSALRLGEPPVIARIERGRCLLDLRAVPESDDRAVRAAVLSVR